MIRARIVGTGSYLPEKILSNHDLEKIVDTTDEWIRTRTGISERRIAEAGTNTSDLALIASQRALEAAGLTPKDIDLIVMSTITPDSACPSASCWLQAKLGAPQAAAFDVVAACSGFIFGLSVAEQYIRTGQFHNILFASAEIMSRTVNWTNRESCVLWGDGAGAVILQPTEEERGVLSVHLHSDGTHGDKLLLPGGGSMASPISHETVAADRHTLKMEGPDSFKVAVRAFTDVCREALEYNCMSVDDIDVFIPHQANIRIIDAVAKRLEMPTEKAVVTIHKYGNISAATIPIALDEAVREGRVKKGNHLLMAAFGGGLTWGAALARW